MSASYTNTSHSKSPWKTDHPPLPSNYVVCERQTRVLTRRLGQTPELLKVYGDIISEQERRGFIDRVIDTNLSENVYYIPHYPVTKDSSTTPIRIVYDCSWRQSSDKPSLNDCLMNGSPLLNGICSILLRFRTHTNGFSTDIEKSFLHMQLSEQNNNYTRFIWQSKPEDLERKFQVYRFKAVLFGATSSSLLLRSAIQHHFEQHNTTIATDTKNLYVDNLISGQPTEQEAILYYKTARSIKTPAKFNLRAMGIQQHTPSRPVFRRGTADNKLQLTLSVFTGIP